MLNQGSTYLYRLLFVLVTAIGFISFALGAMVLSVCVLLLRLLIRQRETRICWNRYLVSRGFALLVTYIRLAGRVDIQWNNWKSLAKDMEHGGVLIANHPSLIDVVIMIARMPRANCIVKKSLWTNPFVGVLVRACGFIPNDGRPEMLDECRQAVAQGEVIIIYPEGSRTSDTKTMTLSRGAANIAIMADVPVLLLTIQRTTPFLTKEVHWYRLPSEAPGFLLSYEGKWELEPYRTLPRAKAARQLTEDWLNFFTDRGDKWDKN
ncbi:lysophospholipid acyltransferase family protein [uncultured Umboniibacter sp.]|uniref:lysophospholipid acyltransferase family protein n=1 Tax=uncultured Umboniibacter sp. TaxID=1798917 RepID=UPI00260F12EC|nr:lysophospholipid acyltransferase family protein [uncultured Umboniibacter sp.]